MLKYAWEQDCPWNAETCCYAAARGHFEMLRWAREHDCPWDKLTCFYAVANGHLDILKWAREHGCPWDKRVCEDRLRVHQLFRTEMLAWVRAQPYD